MSFGDKKLDKAYDDWVQQTPEEYYGVNWIDEEDEKEEEKVCQYCGRATKEGLFCSEECSQANDILKKYREEKINNNTKKEVKRT